MAAVRDKDKEVWVHSAQKCSTRALRFWPLSNRLSFQHRPKAARTEAYMWYCPSGARSVGFMLESVEKDLSFVDGNESLSR